MGVKEKLRGIHLLVSRREIRSQYRMETSTLRPQEKNLSDDFHSIAKGAKVIGTLHHGYFSFFG